MIDTDSASEDTSGPDSSENGEAESAESFDSDSYDDSSSLSESSLSSDTSVSSASEADTVLLSPDEEILDERTDEYAIMHDVLEEERLEARRQARFEARRQARLQARRQAVLEARRDADEGEAQRLERRYDQGEPIFRGMQSAYAHISAFLLAMDRRSEAREALVHLVRETCEAREALEDREIDPDSESILDPDVFPDFP